jgi:hypothetical protein
LRFSFIPRLVGHLSAGIILLEKDENSKQKTENRKPAADLCAGGGAYGV